MKVDASSDSELIINTIHRINLDIVSKLMNRELIASNTTTKPKIGSNIFHQSLQNFLINILPRSQ